MTAKHTLKHKNKINNIWLKNVKSESHK